MNIIKSYLRNKYYLYLYGKCRTYVQQYIDNTFEATEIIPNLWLGSIKSACNKEELLKNNIKSIISVHIGAVELYPDCFKYHNYDLCDTENEEIISAFNDILPIIHDNLLQGKATLIHCMVGASRSATIVAAYLVRYHGHSPVSALSVMKEKRPLINPNSGYIKQLVEYYDQKIFLH